MADPIFVVVGSCGEYSDRTEWIVCWFPTQEQAEEHAAKCRAEDGALGERRLDWRYTSPFKPPTLISDPKWHTDYTGTFYHVEQVDPGPAA